MTRERGSGRAQWLPVRRDSPRTASTRPPSLQLPVYAYKQQILQHIQANTLTVIQGESGCGKSVGVPQLILDDALAHGKHVCILVAEPQSDEARSLATHVANLRGTNVGGEIGYLVNPCLRPHDSPHGRVTYVTFAKLFEWLLYSKEAWQKMTHLILDDVDNRTINHDLLFLVVKLILLNDNASPVTRNKKIVVLSGRFSQCSLEEYLSFLIDRDAYRPVVIQRMKETPKIIYLEELKKELPSLPPTAVDMVHTLENFPATGKNIPHKMFDLIGEIVVSQARAGDVFLIFLPGLREMRQLKNTLVARLSSCTNQLMFKVGLLHQQLVPWEQEGVLHCVPTQANIIISTNVAEKSILSKVTYVIDLGMERVCYFKRNQGLNVLALNWTSRMSLRKRAMQRSCVAVFRLFTRQTFESIQEVANIEMSRSCLSHTLLRMKAKMNSWGPVDVLFDQLPDPPGLGRLNQAFKILSYVGAIDGQSLNDFSLTQLGRLAIALDLDVHVCRLIMLGLLLCCSVECVIIAAGLMMPMDLFQKLYLQSGCPEEFKSMEHELHYFKGKGFYGSGKHNDMIIYCNVYRHWLNKASWEKQWINDTCLNRSGLHFLIEKVHLLALGLAVFLEEEGLVEVMGSEYRKIVELRKGHTNQSRQTSWIFCDDVTAILLSITGAFNTNIFIGNVPNTLLAQEESKEISMAGLDPENTFKISNVPAKMLDNLDNFQESLQVLGPISKVLPLQGSSSALVECSRSSTEALRQITPGILPDAAQRAYFLACRNLNGMLNLSQKRDSKIESMCMGRVTRDRQVFWSTYLKGRKYGVNFEVNSSLPQCAFRLHAQEQFLVAVAAKFIGADNTKVHVSASTLLPFENYFAVTALLLFRSFQAYLIETDSSRKFVYSLQYGPLLFHFCPQYILVDQLHLIEQIWKKLHRRVVESQLCEGYIIEEVLHLLKWVASQKHCEPHQNLSVGTWQEYPSFKPSDVEQSSFAWKLNMMSMFCSSDGTSPIKDKEKNHIVQEAEEDGLLQAFKIVEPDLTRQYVEEWLDGNKDLNQVFYGLLERIMADPGHQEKACLVLKAMHKRCDDLVPKKKRIQLESWYHSLCNPVLADGVSSSGTRAAQAQRLLLQKQNSMEGLDRIPHHMHNKYVPISSKVMRLTDLQINILRRKLGSNANQVKILLPKSQSQTDNVVIFGHPTEVEEAIKWIELVATQSDTRKLWEKCINQTYFLPKRPNDQICCAQLGQGESLYGETSFRGFIQFFLQDCTDTPTPTLQEMGVDLVTISRAIRDRIASADKCLKIEIQARLGRVIFACAQNRKKMLPFESNQPLGAVLDALKKRTFFKQYFSDTVTKADYFHIKACLRLFKSVSVNRQKKITIFLEDTAVVEGGPHITKVTIKEIVDEPGHFQLVEVQNKERLAVVDLVHLRTGHIKSDIRLSVQGLKDEDIEDRYRDFVSKIRLDGVKLKFPKGPFNIGHLRIKDTEEYVYDSFSVSMNEITQMKGKTCLQKYEVEISPLYLGKSKFSVQEVLENLDTFLLKIVTHAQTITSQLLLSWPSSSSSALVHAILCLWKTGKMEMSHLECLVHHHMQKDAQLVDASITYQKQEVNAPPPLDITTLVDILWEVDGLDFDSINLSESVLSFLFRSLQSIAFAPCESTNVRAQEIISQQGFPPRIALAYASLFKCHCFGYHTWTRALAPHLSMLMVEEPAHMNQICHKTLNLLEINSHEKNHSCNLSLESILLALGRHWANRSPTSFLEFYGLALKKEQDSSKTTNNLENFVRKLFSRYPSEAALFVLRLASCYLNGSDRKDTDRHGGATPLLRLLDFIKVLKAIITEDCRSIALGMLLSLEDTNREMQEIEKKIFEIYEVDVTTFRHCHYQKILSETLALRAFHLKELERRGLTNEFCQKMDLKSWIPGRRVASSWLIPGLDKKGKTLIGSPGIFIPARDPSGQIVGAQIKVDQPTSGKYKWLSSNKVFEGGRGPNIDDEWPLFCCTSLFRDFSTLGMCEGGLKAHVLSFLGALPVIGASGAAFSRSKKLLERHLAVINPDRIIFFPDAGSQCNDQVTRCYFQTFRLIREFGYFLLVAWWGQVNKTEHEDIDDLLCNGAGKHNIPLLSPSKFWHILHPAVKKKLADEFPEFSGSSGGALELEKQEKFLDEDGIEISRVLSLDLESKGPFCGEYLISIPKRIMKCMPSPPNDLVTPSSVLEFTLEVRKVTLSDPNMVDTCIDWILQDATKSRACLGLLCRYDSQSNLCLLELSLHQRCLLIQIPSFVDNHVTSRKLQDLLRDADVVKAGVNIDKDSLHLYHCLPLITNNCIKLTLPSAARKQNVQLLDMFSALFKWEWCEKAEVKHSNWRLDLMTLQQIKFGALSAWSCHLIGVQMRESSSGQAKSFSIEGVDHQLLAYFQRSLTNIEASNRQSQTSFELAGATVEIQQGFLILNPANARSKVLNFKSVVELRFNDGRDPAEYTTKKVGDRNVLLEKGAPKLQEADVDVSTISKLVVDNSNYIDMQRQKLEDAIYSLLCNPAACPLHISMALGCIDMGNPVTNKKPSSLPQGMMLNKTQIEALQMMLFNPLCAVIGPPGTGKTRVITGVAKVWEKTTPQGQMLLCAAQQNVAVRHMAETMVKNHVPGVMLLISHDYYNDWRQEEYKHIDEHIVVSGPSIGGSIKAWTARNKGLAPRILLCTLALIGCSSFYTCMKHCNITYMIIDESSQAAEETLISSLICLPRLQRLSVLGDPCQLPPFGNSVQSVFDLVARNCKVVTLELQYRMPQDIANFISREFYRGTLRTATEAFANDLGTSLLWVDVGGSAKTAVGSTSLCNELEAEAIVKLCKKYRGVASTSTSLTTSSSTSLLSSSSLSSSSSSLSSSLSSSSGRTSSSSVPSTTLTSLSLPSTCSNARLVVLTLYEAQRLLISRLLADNEVQGVSVHNVDSFQGQEADIIVVSLVVEARMSPFASDRRRACVLLSRAKCMLYILGNFKAIVKCIGNDRGTQEPIIWKSLALECEMHNWVAKAESLLGHDKECTR